MTPYTLELSSAAWQDLKFIQRQYPMIYKEIIITCLPQLAFEPLTCSEALKGDLSELHAYHFHRKPEFRIIFQLIKQIVLVIAIGSHDEAYRKAKQRN